LRHALKRVFFTCMDGHFENGIEGNPVRCGDWRCRASPVVCGSIGGGSSSLTDPATVVDTKLTFNPGSAL
jgi:hypothetical protein